VRQLLEVGTGFHPELTGPETRICPSDPGMGKRDPRKFDEIVAFAEIENYRDAGEHYSSGMYMRLAFSGRHT